MKKILDPSSLVCCDTTTIARIYDQPKCLSVDEWMKKMWYTYKLEYYRAIQKNEILRFAAKLMELESIMLSKISHIQKDKHFMFSLICGS